MGRKKTSMSERIRRYFETHPLASPAEAAKAINVKPSLVYAVRKYDAAKAKAKAVPALTEPNNVSGVDIDAVHKSEPKADPVNHPAHYVDGGIETIDFLQAKLTREEFIGYLKGNALKYGSRMGKKDDPTVDAGKMAWYTAKLVSVLSRTA